jgi:hypothetical protein
LHSTWLQICLGRKRASQNPILMLFIAPCVCFGGLSFFSEHERRTGTSTLGRWKFFDVNILTQRSQAADRCRNITWLIHSAMIPIVPLLDTCSSNICDQDILPRYFLIPVDIDWFHLGAFAKRLGRGHSLCFNDWGVFLESSLCFGHCK